ncbi:MAG TPA: DUF5681 domain-containing protein [Giesbergeria sp.]|nr:DUF5681 domain-containing protein [Giesbergeria sp.]
MAKFKAGESGNPKGRPKAVPSTVGGLREAIAKQVPQIIDVLVQQALAGDVQAARVLIERAIPAIKPVELPAVLALPSGTLTEKGQAVLQAVAGGSLAPSQGAQLLTGIGTLARVAEVDELERRVKALEESRGKP